MDTVIEQLQTTNIEASANDEIVDQKTSFDGLYKNWGRLGNQEERRKELLEVQKSNRNQKLDKFRGILDLVNAVEDNVKCNYNSDHRVRYRPSIYVAGFNKASHTYRNVLMLSEWIVEKPADFHENWYVVPCPKGTRLLVVATRGSTKAYTKFGQFKFECSTVLPGGQRTNDLKLKHQCCVLDCFYIEKINTMFVLDLLAWNNTPMTDGETEFRHFWLSSKFAEIPELSNITKQNKVIFKILPKISCDPDSFQNFMLSYPPFDGHCPALDGLLFYHKRAHYVSGETPLFGWLYPYMVPEVLGSDIKINSCYSSEKPVGYVNQADFIQKFEAKHEKKNKTNRTKKMSTSSGTSETQTTATESQKPTQESNIPVTSKKNKKKQNKNKGVNIMDAEVTNAESESSTETMEAETVRENSQENMDESRLDEEPSSGP